MMDLIYEMNEWVHTYYGSGVVFWLAVAAYLYLFTVSREKRWKFVYPVVLIVFLLLNPVLYKYAYKGTHYWRWFWTVPNALVIAGAAVTLIRNAKKRWHKAFLCMVMVAVLLLFGENFYTNQERFFPTQNAYKIEQETVDVCDLMLEREASPKCICPLLLCNRVRLYSGEIRQYYGRDAEWDYANTDNPKVATLRQLESEHPDYAMVLQTALEQECGFVVTHADRKIEQSILDNYHFSMIGETGEYAVYHFGT